MITLLKTCFGTGGLARCVDLNVVTESVNNFLLYLVVTNCAVLTLGKTGVITGRSYCLVNLDLMTERGNNLLRCSVAVTSGAVRTFSKTCFGTGGSNRLVDYHMVTVRSNLLLSKKSFTTYRALLTIGNTCFCAGCCLACYGFLGVSESRYLFGVAVTTATGVSDFAFNSASSFLS